MNAAYSAARWDPEYATVRFSFILISARNLPLLLFQKIMLIWSGTYIAMSWITAHADSRENERRMKDGKVRFEWLILWQISVVCKVIKELTNFNIVAKSGPRWIFAQRLR
jgi:hypothetical protein